MGAGTGEGFCPQRRTAISWGLSGFRRNGSYQHFAVEELESAHLV